MRTQTTTNRALVSRVLGAALLVAVPPAALAQVEGPPPQLVVTNVVTDLAGPPCTLMARGRNFQRNPGRDSLEVRLADDALDVIDSGDTWLLADFDCATPPGDYLLTVRRGPSQTDFDALSLTVGAVGPPGPQGEAGPAGPPGPSGFGDLVVAHLLVNEPLDTVTYFVTCPAGTRVIGGAWDATHNVSGVPIVMAVGASFPFDDSTWGFRVIAGVAGNDLVDFMAICVNE